MWIPADGLSPWKVFLANEKWQIEDLKLILKNFKNKFER